LLTATGGVTTHDTTVTINYVLDGVIRQKTAITTGATPTTDGNSGAAITLTANQARVAVWCLNSSGTLSVRAGAVVAWDGVAFNMPPPMPDIPDTVVPFATQMLKAGSTAGTITFGSSNWNATGFTNSIENICVPRARPRTS
jgi:hypothetical protein